MAVFSRGRIVSEDIARDLRETGVFRQYVVGEIYADFLDLDDARDVVTSDRQRLVEEDPRYLALQDFLRSVLNHIQNRWTNFRREIGIQRTFDDSPVMRTWFDRLSRSHQDYARKLIGRIEGLPIPDKEAKKEIYRSSLIAFEKLALTESLRRLDNIETQRDFERLSELFASVDEYEATQYFQIVDTRLRVIRTLRGAVETGNATRIVQDHLPDHLWLLDPAWERAATDLQAEALAQKIYERLEGDARYATIETEGIRYRYAGGRHIVIDFRPYEERITVGSIIDQVNAFRDAFGAEVAAAARQRIDPIEYVCLLGWPIESRTLVQALESVGARAFTYSEVISRAEQTYNAYLERQQEVAKVVRLIDRLVDVLSEEIEAVDLLPSTTSQA